MEKDVCKLCGEKLKKKQDSAIYYCIRCENQKNKEKSIKDKLKS